MKKFKTYKVNNRLIASIIVIVILILFIVCSLCKLNSSHEKFINTITKKFGNNEDYYIRSFSSNLDILLNNYSFKK